MRLSAVILIAAFLILQGCDQRPRKTMPKGKSDQGEQQEKKDENTFGDKSDGMYQGADALGAGSSATMGQGAGQRGVDALQQGSQRSAMGQQDPRAQAGGAGGTDDPLDKEDFAAQLGMSMAELAEGERKIGDWDGLQDEVPPGSEWVITAVQVGPAAVSPPQTQPAPAGNPGAMAGQPQTMPNGTSQPMNGRGIPNQGGQFPGSNQVPQVNPLNNQIANPMAGTQPMNPMGGNQAFNPMGGGQGVNPMAGQFANPMMGQNGVIFRIRRGTGQGAWNSPHQPVIARVGVPLTIVNDDVIPHRLFTRGIPCEFRLLLQPGQQETCVPMQVFNQGPLFDRTTRGLFYIRVVQ